MLLRFTDLSGLAVLSVVAVEKASFSTRFLGCRSYPTFKAEVKAEPSILSLSLMLAMAAASENVDGVAIVSRDLKSSILGWGSKSPKIMFLDSFCVFPLLLAIHGPN